MDEHRRTADNTWPVQYTVGPLDLNILKGLKRSPLGLNRYLWFTYRTFALKCPIRLTWKQLCRQPPPAQARDAGIADKPVLS